jgi:hypothetical protein
MNLANEAFGINIHVVYVPVCGLPSKWLAPGSVFPKRSPRCRRATIRLKKVGILSNQLTMSKTLMSKATSLLDNQMMSNKIDTPTKPENWYSIRGLAPTPGNVFETN